jgi:hypothetical protein
MATPESGSDESVLAGGDVLENELSSDFRFFYANTVRGGITRFDLLLIFGRIVERKAGIAVAEDQCEVRMSPQFFKTVALQMNALISTYEQQFGEVQVPTKTAMEVTDGIRQALSPKIKPPS